LAFLTGCLTGLARQVKDNLEIASRVNEKRRWLLLDNIMQLYTIPERASLSRSGSRPATRSASPPRPPTGGQRIRTQEEKYRDQRVALLGHLLDAVARWREREDAKAVPGDEVAEEEAAAAAAAAEAEADSEADEAEEEAEGGAEEGTQ
jgi:hypothetical protein